MPKTQLSHADRWILCPGNCLFHALSDQLYGDQSRHQEIRAAVIRSMRANSDYYKHFIEVHPGGGTRRNPKRKNTGAFSSKQIAPEATAAEKDAVFEGHLARMARGGTYGDNMEITAFSKAYNAEVIIYRSEYAYCVRDGGITGPYKSLHIAYHVSIPLCLSHHIPAADNMARHTSITLPSATFVDPTQVFLTRKHSTNPWRLVMKPKSSWSKDHTLKTG